MCFCFLFDETKVSDQQLSCNKKTKAFRGRSFDIKKKSTFFVVFYFFLGAASRRTKTTKRKQNENETNKFGVTIEGLERAI